MFDAVLTLWQTPNESSRINSFPPKHNPYPRQLQTPMNKTDLVAAVQKNLGKETTRASAERAVEAVVDGIKSGLKKDHLVQLVGFGTFKVTTRKARVGTNPKTKEKIKIKPEALTELIIGYAFDHCVGLINRLFICCLIDFLFSNLDHFKVTLEIVFERFWPSCGSK